MKIPNKWELKQIASQNSSDIDFQDFFNLYKKLTAKNHVLILISHNTHSENPTERI